MKKWPFWALSQRVVFEGKQQKVSYRSNVECRRSAHKKLMCACSSAKEATASTKKSTENW